MEEPPETPWHGAEAWRPRIWPVWVNKFYQVLVVLVAGPLAGGELPLGDVARGEVTQAQEVRGASDVAFLLARECRQPRQVQALFPALCSCETKENLMEPVSYAPWMHWHGDMKVGLQKVAWKVQLWPFI